MRSIRRLYRILKPTNYKLSLTLNETAKTFSGQLVLTGESTVRSSKIYLHSKELNIKSALINDQEAAFKYLKNDELELSGVKVAPGPITIQIDYNGDITDPMHGLYPSNYKDGGKNRVMFSTQLESHHARELFPCIDEPEAKATFDLMLDTAADMQVLSNTTVKSSQILNDRKVSVFKTTPRMSTYLLAFAIGDLTSAAKKTKKGVTVSIWGTSNNNPEHYTFALDVAVKSIEFFEDYFKVPYPLEKADLVAIPDFSSGAMENWGCITFRETALLVDPKNTSIASKQWIAEVIAHELAHQWFGNLVTMRWWDDLWLNESFATLMATVCTEKLFPEWKPWLTFATQESISALRRDRFANVQAVRTGVRHPDEINMLFDPSIVYAKGAKLLQMLYNYVGESAWRRGLTAYFKKHKYGNTHANDLWAALSATSKQDVGKFMTPWLERPGYPVLTVESLNDNRYRISQKRFVLGGKLDLKTWQVPLSANTSVLPSILTKRSQIFTVKKSSVPFKLSVDDHGYYISYYKNVEHRKALQQAIKQNKFSVLDRLQLLHDASLLSSAGIYKQTDVLELLTAYENESSEAVWNIITAVIGDTRKLIEHDKEATNNLKKYVARLIDKQYKRLGWRVKRGESEFDTQLRGLIIGLGIFANHEHVKKEALKRFNEFTDPESLEPNLRSAIYIAGVKYGGKDGFKKVIKLYKNAKSAEEQANLRDGLTAVREESQVNFLLGKLKDKNFVRLQDFTYWFAYLMRNTESRSYMWDWMKAEWDGWIKDNFHGDKSYDTLPRYAAGAFSSRDELQSYTDFFRSKTSDIAIKRVIITGIQELRARIAWHDRDAIDIKRYLASL